MEAVKTFAALNCTSLELRFEVAKDKFDAEKFIQIVRVQDGGAFCHTQMYDRIDYHVHLAWTIDEKDVTLSVSYHPPGAPPEKGEKEPFAEAAVSWLGQFFANETAHADMGAKFRYDSDRMQSRFPLPIRLAVVQDLDTEIDGVSFNLPTKPNGVDGLFIMNVSDKINVQVKGGTKVRFKDFDPINVIVNVSSLVRKFMIPKRPATVPEVQS